ncbi:MAG TPA: methylmalonyl-CoA epimerase [Candidatus Marinimicrobia bacterium]|nr:methylmalonyl-CoA epimerase [Candidatus Neomarinimicrobiota bacterium]
MIKKLNHIGIAVNSIAEHIPFYRDILQLKFVGIEEIADQKVKTAIFQVGETRIELLEATAPDSPIAQFLEKRGEGLHHLAYQSDNIERELQFLRKHNVALIDEKPRGGAHHTRIAFLHPKSTGKVLTEICEEKR